MAGEVVETGSGVARVRVGDRVDKVLVFRHHLDRHLDPAVRQAGIDHLRWCIDCAAALGAPILAGPTYQALGRFTVDVE